jgi:hypothetical protein
MFGSVSAVSFLFFKFFRRLFALGALRRGLVARVYITAN